MFCHCSTHCILLAPFKKGECAHECTCFLHLFHIGGLDLLMLEKFSINRIQGVNKKDVLD